MEAVFCPAGRAGQRDKGGNHGDEGFRSNYHPRRSPGNAECQADKIGDQEKYRQLEQGKQGAGCDTARMPPDQVKAFVKTPQFLFRIGEGFLLLFYDPQAGEQPDKPFCSEPGKPPEEADAEQPQHDQRIDGKAQEYQIAKTGNLSGEFPPPEQQDYQRIEGQAALVNDKFDHQRAACQPKRDAAFDHRIGLDRLSAAGKRGNAVEKLADHGGGKRIPELLFGVKGAGDLM